MAISDPFFSNIINNSLIKIMQMNRMSYMKPVYTPCILPIKCNFTNNSYNINNCKYNTTLSVNKNKTKTQKRILKANNKKGVNITTGEIAKKPKNSYDFYTPRFVKGKGLKRMGKCPCCPQQPGTWYATKTSAYRLVKHIK